MPEKSELYDLKGTFYACTNCKTTDLYTFLHTFKQQHTWDTSHDKRYVVTPLILCKNIEVCTFNTLHVIFTHMVHVLDRNMLFQ
jgi:hypothetical protein